MSKPRHIIMTNQPDPKHVRIFEVSLRVPLLRVNEVGELGRITYEEYGCIVENPIPVALICFKLGRKATGIASSIRRARLPSDCGEADSRRNLLANLMEQLLRRDITQVMSNLEVTVCSGAFCMDLISNKSGSKFK
jgi:hypothetical protein